MSFIIIFICKKIFILMYFIIIKFIIGIYEFLLHLLAYILIKIIFFFNLNFIFILTRIFYL